MSDDAKKTILARRARFVATALAGVSIACGKESAPQPQPCLSPPYVAPDAEPMPCLSPVYVPPPDAEAAPDAGADDAGAEPDAAKPMPCLSPARNPTSSPTSPPRPCLSVSAPPKPKVPQGR